MGIFGPTRLYGSAVEEDLQRAKSKNPLEYFRGQIGSLGSLWGAPEFKISEAFAAEPEPVPTTPQQQVTTFPESAVQGNLANLLGYNQSTNNFPGSGGQVLGTTTTDTNINPEIQNYDEAIAPLMQTYADIESQYNAQMGQIPGQIQSEYAPAIAEVETGRQQGLQKVGVAKTEAQQSEKSSLARARQLFNEMQQKNIAAASAAGASFSSYPQAI